MAKIRYLDFDLRIKHAEVGYRAEVVSCPAGRGSTEFESPFSELEVENLLLRMGRPRRGVRRVCSMQGSGRSTLSLPTSIRTAV